MRLSRLILASAVMGMAGAGVYGQQQPPAPPAPPAQPALPAQPAPPGQVAPRDAAGVQAIREAADPSAAVQAYSAAVARGGADVAVEDAYVRRMVSFNLPDLAEAQAQDVLKHEPNNQVARAVVAYMQGRRGQAVDALRTIVQATGGNQPVTDPFILHTAGQLVAWYDTRADKAQIPAQLRTDVEAMRHKLSAQDEYGLAYGSARDAYQGKTQQPAQAYEQGVQQPEAVAPVEPTPVPDVGTYDNSYAYPYTYEPYPYGYTGATYYYPYNYWPRDHRWSGHHVYEPAPVIIPRHDRHDHDHDHDWNHGGNDGHHWGGDHHDRDGDHDHDGGHGYGGGASPPRVHPYGDTHPSRNRLEPSVTVPRVIEPRSSGSTGHEYGHEQHGDVTPRRSGGEAFGGGASHHVDSPPPAAPRPQQSPQSDHGSSWAGARESRSTSPGGDARRSR